MNKKFIQSLMNQTVFRKLTAAFPELKKEKLEDADLSRILKDLSKGGLLEALKESEQDPKELKEMVLAAFDENFNLLRKRLDSFTTIVADALEKESKK